MSLRSIGLNEWLKFKKFVSQDGMGTTGKDKEIINHIGKALVYLLPLLKDLFNFVVVEVSMFFLFFVPNNIYNKKKHEFSLA